MQAHTLAEWWEAARKRIQKDERHGFDSLVLLSCWMIWKERNNRTFNRRVQTIDEVLALVVDEIVSWFAAGFKCLECVIAILGRVPGRTIEPV